MAGHPWQKPNDKWSWLNVVVQRSIMYSDGAFLNLFKANDNVFAYIDS